ncbi:hypothetical protein [Teredinibacter turnerae]|nr:hypothetical protein [Teredinibacter turnerae]
MSIVPPVWQRTQSPLTEVSTARIGVQAEPFDPLGDILMTVTAHQG